MSDPLARRLAAIVRASPRLMQVLAVARDLDLPQWRVVSGAVYQTVWNALTGRPADHGIRDYDLFYFDASDVSYEAEDVVIRRAAAAFPPDLSPKVEVRNQARVHLWFEQHFGEPYAPLSSSDEAIGRFVAPAFAVGVRLAADGAIDIAAPFGLDDVFAMRLRPNPSRPLARGWEKTTASVQARWPELTLVAP
ncbi:MAG: nucleotidyltransferase family protein [Caulobacteraceae bacterium]|nr:nucleotidyltransferase family protein [Caulobacteraceae bacterium]